MANLSARDIETIARAAEMDCPVAVYSSRVVDGYPRSMPPARNMPADVARIECYAAVLVEHGDIDVHVSLDLCG